MKTETDLTKMWDGWNSGGGPKYPHEKAIQFTFRNFPAGQRAVPALDLGCGGGVHTVFLAVEGFDVTAVDLSPEAVEQTKRRVAAAGVKADVRAQPVQRLDLPPGRFKLVLSMAVLDCAGLENTRVAIPKVRDAMAPGGVGAFLFASDRDFRTKDPAFPYPLHPWVQEEVAQVFDVGFAEVHIDRHLTTYQGGRTEQNEFLVTVRR